MFGGQGDDVVGLSGTGDLLGFGNLGNDTLVLQSSGTLFGGQGSDQLYAVNQGSHFLSGDLGDDVLFAGAGAGPGAGGYDTLVGGRGSDDIHLSSPDVAVSVGGVVGAGATLGGQGAASLLYAAGDRRAGAPGRGGGAGSENIDRVFGFQHATFGAGGAISGGDQIHLAGLPDLVTPGLLSPGNVGVAAGIAAGYAAAYAYAYGGAAAGHFAQGVAYLEVQVSDANPQGGGFYLFADDASHTAIFFSQGTAGATLQTGDVVAG